jgi:hypothetical protein
VIDRDVEVTVILIADDVVCIGLLLSLTVTVKVNFPLAVGVPEIIPLLPASFSPVGKLPEVMDHV